MKTLGFALFLFTILSCSKKNDKTKFLLLSDREAPLGWSYFTINKDSTFEFVTRGLTDRSVFYGKASITKDTIFLSYNDSIAIIGTKVLWKKEYVEFIEFNNTKFRTRLNRLVK